MKKKGISILLLMINIIGTVCLVFFAVPYLTHDTRVIYPDAMLPMEKWDRAGILLTAGLLPLLTANISGFLLVTVRQKIIRFLFLVPGIICAVLAGSYWLTAVG